MGGPSSHSTMGQKRVSTASMAQPRRTSPPLPSLSLFPALLFFGVALSYGARSEPKTAEEAKTRSQVQQRRTGGPRNDNTVGLLAYLTDHTTHPHMRARTHTHTHTHTHARTHTLLLPSSYPHSPTSPHPPTSLPPTSHMPDFIRHPEKKTGNMLLAWKMLSPHSSA